MRAELFSLGYRLFRALSIAYVFTKQNLGERPRDFEEVVELGHKIMRRLPPLFTRFEIPNGIDSNLYDLKFDSPITVASFENDPAILQVYLDLGAGGVCLKTAMREPRSGNVRPRMQRVSIDGEECLVNAMGLPGKGIAALVREYSYSEVWCRPVGLSVGGNCLDDYLDNFVSLNDPSFHKDRPHYFEVNASCPNTEDGKNLLKKPEQLKELLDYMRRQTDVPIGVKLDPDLKYGEIGLLVALIAGVRDSFVNFGNTSFRKCSDVGLPAKAISRGGGGLSGPAIYPRVLELVKFSQNVSPRTPVIATGGVYCAEQVAELRRAGACLVGVATSIGQDMYRIPKINYGLEKIMLDGL